MRTFGNWCKENPIKSGLIAVAGGSLFLVYLVLRMQATQVWAATDNESNPPPAVSTKKTRPHPPYEDAKGMSAYQIREIYGPPTNINSPAFGAGLPSGTSSVWMYKDGWMEVSPDGVCIDAGKNVIDPAVIATKEAKGAALAYLKDTHELNSPHITSSRFAGDKDHLLFEVREGNQRRGGKRFNLEMARNKKGIWEVTKITPR